MFTCPSSFRVTAASSGDRVGTVVWVRFSAEPPPIWPGVSFYLAGRQQGGSCMGAVSRALMSSLAYREDLLGARSEAVCPGRSSGAQAGSATPGSLPR